MSRIASTRISKDNKPITLREAVVLGVKSGWTSKETAYETNWNHNSLQSYAARMSLSFAYAGQGNAPKYTPSKLESVQPNIKLVYKESRFTKK